MSVRVIPVRWQPPLGRESLFDLGLNSAEGTVLGLEILRQGGLRREIRGLEIAWNDAVPRFEIGEAAAGIERASDNDGREDE